MSGNIEQNVSRKKTNEGKGFVNSLIDKLPIELHIPGGYQYCGPGTKLKKRLARGDPGINLLDKACKEHDIAYVQSNDIDQRHIADQKLINKAIERTKAKDASIGEKASSFLVEKIMKMKTKFGMGMGCGEGKKKRKQQKTKKIKTGGGAKKKLPTFNQIVGKSKQKITKVKKPQTLRKSIQLALQVARKVSAKDKKSIKKPRIIKVPKTGGILPLIPIFAGLSALGALGGGAAGIAKAVIAAKEATNQLKESKKHNRTMESIAMGRGMFLKPHKTGLGIYLNPNQKN